MGLIIIVGYMGSGKTLLSTDMALTSKVPVICNYDIGDFEILDDGSKKLIKRHPNTHVLELDQLMHLPFDRCKVILDEAYTYLESRISMSKLNLYMSYILFQSRKRGIDIIITAQLAGTIDHRFIDLADVAIGAKQIKDGFLYAFSDGRTVQYRKMSLVNASKIWDKYDTNQVIMPPNISNLETTVEIMDRKKLKQKIDDLEKKFFKEYPDNVKVTHAIVESFLLDNDLSDEYERYLYSRLQKNNIKCVDE